MKESKIKSTGANRTKRAALTGALKIRK